MLGEEENTKEGVSEQGERRWRKMSGTDIDIGRLRDEGWVKRD